MSEKGWKIYDTTNTKHLTHVIMRIEHVIKNMSKSYPGDIIAINMESIDNIFVDNNRRKIIDVAKIDPLHTNWSHDNPFPLNCTPEILDYKEIWADTKYSPSIPWDDFLRVHKLPGLTIVMHETTKLYVFKLILSKENTIRLHKRI